jgi:hypothetical protein
MIFQNRIFWRQDNPPSFKEVYPCEGIEQTRIYIFHHQPLYKLFAILDYKVSNSLQNMNKSAK